MGSVMRNLGSLVHAESSYSNEQDPWENDVPMSFQSTRRESRAKPPMNYRNPRAFTLPNLLSLRSHVRNRSSDSEYMPYSPNLSRAPPFSSPRSVANGRERVVDDHNVPTDISPGNMTRSFIGGGNRSTVCSMEPKAGSKNGNTSRTQSARSHKNRQRMDSGGRKVKSKSGGVGDIPGLSPVSEEADEEERSSWRKKWIKGRVRRVLRLGRRERPQV